MNESVFITRIESELLYGIHHHSIHNTTKEKNIAIIMLHGWGGYRTGPHDMLVKLARELACDGYDCFRFDFRGKGYSQGESKHTTNQTMLKDLETIIEYINHQLDNPLLVLIGICSGARLALYYARNGKYPILHVIELSSPVLNPRQVQSELAAQHAYNTIFTYIKKIFELQTWLKFVSGDINLKAIWRNIAQPYMRLINSSRTTLSTKNNKSLQPKKGFQNFSGKILIIHGEKDPETHLAVSQINNLLTKYKISHTNHIVKNANHSFYSIFWEKEIILCIRNWLHKEI